MRKLSLIIIFFSLIIVLSQCNNAREKHQISADQIEKASKIANDFFNSTFDEEVDRSPEYQTRLGIKKDYDKWDDKTDEFAAKEYNIAQDKLQYLRDSIDFEHLDKAAQLSYKLFEKNLKNKIASYQYRYHNYPINQMFGFHADAPAFLINFHRIDDQSDAEAYVSRLEKLESSFVQQIEKLITREEKGIILPKFLYWRVIEASRNVISGNPFDNTNKVNAIWEDFNKKLDNLEMDDTTKSDLKRSCRKALNRSVKPAYDQLIFFLEDQEKRAVDDAGAWKFPDGEAFYNSALERTTTTTYTAAEIHEIGLKEVARIHGEMEDIMKQVGFDGDLQAFFEFMASDKQFYMAETAEAKQMYLDSATMLIDKMKEQLDGLFLTKPQSEMIVKRVEAFREKSGGKAFYNRPAPDGSRPGIYYVNLYKMANMPTYEMEALAYHEGIPGHHMQLAIAQELKDIPKFRKFGGYTAYVEGWALYCETVPKEIGMYKNPYSDFGRLAMELWRACRLVVDTGIHHKKWTRDQGIVYYGDNTPAPEEACIKMVERHIVMPSQATAYKIGMIKIMTLREKAKAALGEDFDIRQFHEVVLTNGPVPLDILENLVDEWITAKSA